MANKNKILSSTAVLSSVICLIGQIPNREQPLRGPIEQRCAFILSKRLPLFIQHIGVEGGVGVEREHTSIPWIERDDRTRKRVREDGVDELDFGGAVAVCRRRRLQNGQGDDRAGEACRRGECDH